MSDGGPGRVAAALLERNHDVQQTVQHPGGLLPHRNATAHVSATPRADQQRMASLRFQDIDELAQLVHKTMDASTSDFRTPHSLAEELGASEADVRAALVRLDTKVRRPLGGEDLYPNWYRLTSKGRTWREIWWRFRAVAGLTTPGM
jgi:hypothetical protein